MGGGNNLLFPLPPGSKMITGYEAASLLCCPFAADLTTDLSPFNCMGIFFS